MPVSGNVILDSGCFDHYLVWMEIGRVTKRGKKVKRVLRRWHLERFDDIKIRVTYQKELQAEILGFMESVSQKVESCKKGEYCRLCKEVKEAVSWRYCRGIIYEGKCRRQL